MSWERGTQPRGPPSGDYSDLFRHLTLPRLAKRF